MKTEDRARLNIDRLLEAAGWRARNHKALSFVIAYILPTEGGRTTNVQKID